MYHKSHSYLIGVLFVVLAALFFFVPFGDSADIAFLTISTFLFAIFAGFFISRQGTRYSAIRNSITEFDGNISFLYRAVGHFGDTTQEKAAGIAREYYNDILKHKAWDYSFTHKTTILTLFQLLISGLVKEKDTTPGDGAIINRMVEALRMAQVARKRLVALYQERVPHSQWVLIYFLTAILLVTLATIPSVGDLLAALLKSAFATSVVFVVMLLQRFDDLEFFEGIIGESSAQDVLNIIKGER